MPWLCHQETIFPITSTDTIERQNCAYVKWTLNLWYDDKGSPALDVEDIQNVAVAPRHESAHGGRHAVHVLVAIDDPFREVGRVNNCRVEKKRWRWCQWKLRTPQPLYERHNKTAPETESDVNTDTAPWPNSTWPLVRTSARSMST